MQIITQYMCRYCGQQFDSPSVMQLHIQDHVQGKTAHQCSVCGKEYRTPSKLQRHVRVHSGERPYACSVCGRRFTRSDHVKQHMKVHFQPKDVNVCHLCNDMKFNRRQALHAHLQQQHLISQVFSCHRCGEAYESLEEMQSHKLTHDSILNSMKEGNNLSSYGVAKFSLGPQKIEQSCIKDDIKMESVEDFPNTTGFVKVQNKTFFVQPMDGASIGGSKSGINVAAGLTSTDLEQQIQEELKKLKEGTGVYQDQPSIKNEETKVPTVEWFTIKADNSLSKEADLKEFKNKETTTMVAEDGMKMFILPTNTGDDDETSHSSTKRSFSDVDDDDDEDDDIMIEALEDENEQNSSKESVGVGVNREGDVDTADDEKSELDKSNVDNDSEATSNEGRISDVKSVKIVGYSKPCPKSKKPGYIPPVEMATTAASVTPTTTSATAAPVVSIKSEYPLMNIVSTQAIPAQPMYTTSLLSPRISELIKAKVEQSQSVGHQMQPQTIIFTNNSSLNAQSMPKLTLIPNGSQALTFGSLQSVITSLNSGIVTNTTAASTSTTADRHVKSETPKLLRCEHCCIWFEDNAMSLLHNTLHSADETDPFTCRKCYKKLGNRLEFMAHLVWHLEPNMDI